MSVAQMISDANHRNSMMNQKRFAKSGYVKSTATEQINMLCERITDIGEAFYRDKGDMRQAMKDALQAVSVAQKWTRENRA